MLMWLKEKKLILLVVLGTISVVVFMKYWNANSNAEALKATEWSIPAVTNEQAEQSEDVLEETISNGEDAMAKMVDVKGAVVRPGVYELSEEDRVIDVIDKAGGLTAEADQSKVNLAMKVEDEMVVYVPKIGEEMEVESVTPTIPSSEEHGSKVNLNTASLDELQTLPGIGPSKAQAILDYREQNGKFKSIEELKDVTGIGDKTFDKLQTTITVN